MDKLKLCADAFSKLFYIKYHCIIGRKGKTREFLLVFDSYHFHHLAGLHKLSDMPELRKNRERVFKDIMAGKLTYDMISQSIDFPDIKSRFDYLHRLEAFMDSNDIIFHYDKCNDPSSRIDAVYLLQNEIDGDINYFFIDKGEDDNFFGRSFFLKTQKDFTVAQQRWTLLYKEKIYVKTGAKIIQYDKLSPKQTDNR